MSEQPEISAQPELITAEKPSEPPALPVKSKKQRTEKQLEVLRRAQEKRKANIEEARQLKEKHQKALEQKRLDDERLLKEQERQAIIRKYEQEKLKNETKNQKPPTPKVVRQRAKPVKAPVPKKMPSLEGNENNMVSVSFDDFGGIFG